MQQGYRMLECDVRLSADGIPFLLHDDHLDRTTSGHGTADRPWSELSGLDAGAWHSPEFAGERMPTLSEVAAFSLGQPTAHWVNLEIKPGPGVADITGRTVALQARALWRSHADRLPLLTSFQTGALSAALSAAPELPRGLLISQLSDDGAADRAWLDTARELACCAVVLQHRLWNADRVAMAHAGGLRCLSYTVNEPEEARRLLDLGLDGLITDRVDHFDPAAA